VFTDGSSPDLVRAMRSLIHDLPALRAGVHDFVTRRAPEWDARFAELQRLLRDRNVRG
jgi:hypothetical protein